MKAKCIGVALLLAANAALLALDAAAEEAAVDELTHRLARDGYERLSGPRRTGDGYYESVILDPEGNRIEITV